MEQNLYECLVKRKNLSMQKIKSLFKKIKPKFILFSSTSESKPGWDEQWGHINVKQQADWVLMFKKMGYELDRHLFYPTVYSKLFKLCL